MKSDDPMAGEILKRTLLEVRSARRRRLVLRKALGTLVVLVAAVFLWPRPATVRGPEGNPVASDLSPPPVLEEKIAVMVWRGGTPCLEWVELHDLGSVELEFSLEPVFAFADDGM
jgi:hypothetical protein